MAARYKLTDRQVRNLRPGTKLNDGGGLWVHCREGGSTQWVLRVTVHGRRREMGLGGIDTVSLAQAREIADKWRGLAKAGTDPIIERDKQRREAKRNLYLLEDVARDAFEARKADLKGDGKAGRWFSPLERHILPKLGHLPVTQIDQHAIKEALKPLWHSKADTARKALNRLGLVLKHAAAIDLNVDLQATDKAKALLGKTRHVPQHIPAMHWQEVPEFYDSLSDGTVVHLALRLLILTGVRSAAARHCRWEQIEGDVWTVPAEYIKGRLGRTRDFRVPLSDEAMTVLRDARAHERNGWLFPSPRAKNPISDMSMSRHMERRGLDARPHGFRASLRSWLADCTDASHEVAETVLGHKILNAVQAAYQRSDHLEQRRVLMQRWTDHVTGKSGALVRLAASDG
ncbi:tyrosine-type recombinase/integrase [Thalassococcus lentus]|uniref:Integrase arm-type DNA-binding domain-containing protein n=1 Tax=Thalassococcus lentus TaxID=1210524 RepID=A0ABT4XUC0_9RHOB|nr:integrase arm-type DNA-binding domain-containing protein [Thalassococcus lentus]MDA7425569.1 integrase arm-type DNA-binding domain-containing protein [Thalassococcus lentus]